MAEFFIGIDLGIEKKKTSAICILERKNFKVCQNKEWCKNCQDIKGKFVFKKLKPFLKNTKIIAIDSPLTKGKGKGRMRLFEKFFSRKVFREAKINPVPPALIPKVCDFGRKLLKKLEKEGFVLDLNLIETSSRISGAFLNSSLLSKFFKTLKTPCKTKNQKTAFVAAILAFLHSTFQTRYIGYKDGFLFLPKISFWKKFWRKKFYFAWKERPRLKYRYLITNIFEK
jgi:predicted nuclease with RNAse H fold